MFIACLLCDKHSSGSENKEGNEIDKDLTPWSSHSSNRTQRTIKRVRSMKGKWWDVLCRENSRYSECWEGQVSPWVCRVPGKALLSWYLYKGTPEVSKKMRPACICGKSVLGRENTFKGPGGDYVYLFARAAIKNTTGWVLKRKKLSHTSGA